MNLEVNTYLDGGEFSLEIDKFSGEGFFNTSDDDIDIDDFEVKINEIIDEDNLDIIIEEGDGNIENIDSVEDLIDEAYEGQMTLVAGTFVGLAGKAILSALIAAIAYAAKVIVVAGITYYAVDRVADKIKNGFIYRAYRANNAVYISPLSITKSQAIRLVRLGKDVYTLLKAHAKSIVASTGLGVTQSENHYYTSRKRGIYYSHFHTANRNGAHSFYGLPLIK
ncbi:TPA: hypothetical protein U1160_002107 [Streptococcus suis]|nr:hypothetical protein [Streptococcus suis]HEM4926391.1 hypothetical protein [Streptococcus suis]